MVAVMTAVDLVRQGKELRVWRCRQCNRILARLLLAPGSAIEVKCHSCNTLSTIETQQDGVPPDTCTP